MRDHNKTTEVSLKLKFNPISQSKSTIFFGWVRMISCKKSQRRNQELRKHYVMRCAIWYHLYDFKNVKNTHGGVLLLVAKSNTPSWVFFTFFKLYKWYQIA